MISITFADDHLTVTAAVGAKLAEVCDEHSTSLLFGCRDGVCGTCLLEVVSGLENLNPITPREQDMLEIMAEGNPKARLGCQLQVMGDIQIRMLS